MGCKLHTRERPDSDTLFTHQDQRKEEQYQQGISHYNLEEFDKALKIFKKLMQLDSDNFEYVFQTACTQKKMKHYDDSLNNFQKAVNISKHHAQSYYKKVDLYFKLQKIDSINHIDREIKGILDDQDVNNIYGKILYKQKKYQEAISIFKFFIIKQQNIETNIFALKQLGKIYYQQKQFHNCLEQCKMILNIDKTNVFANKLCGLIKYEEQQYQQAIIYFNECLKLKNNNPSFKEIKLLIVRSLFELKDYLGVIKISNEFKEIQQNNVYWIQDLQIEQLIVQAYYNLKEYIQCKKVLLQILEFNKEDKDAIHLIGKCYYYLGKYDLCIHYLKHVEKTHPNSRIQLLFQLQFWEYLTLIYQDTRKQQKSSIKQSKEIEALQKPISQQRKFYENTLVDESKQMLQKLIQLYPNEGAYLQRLNYFKDELQILQGNLLFQQQKYEQVIIHCQSIEHLKNNETFLKLIGLSYMQLGEYAACEPYLRALLKVNQKNFQAQYYLAICLFFKNDYKASLEIFQQINSDKDEFQLEINLHKGTLLLLTKCLFYLENYYESIEIFNQIVNQYRKNFDALIFQAQCYFKLNKFVKVIAIAQEVIDSDSTDKTFALEIQGMSFYNLSKYEKAKSVFDQLIQQNKDNSIALYYKGIYILKLGLISLKLKNYQESIELFKQVIKLSPKQQEIHYYLGKSYYKLQQYNESQQELQLAQKLDVKNKEIKIFIINCLFQLKNYDQVLLNCEKLLQAQLSDEEINYFARVMKGISLSLKKDYENALNAISPTIKEPFTQIRNLQVGRIILVIKEFPFDDVFQYKQYLIIGQYFIDKGSSNTNSLILMGISCFYQKQYKAGIMHFQKLAEIDPNKKESYQRAILASKEAENQQSLDIEKAILLYQDKKYDNAKEIFIKILLLDSSNISANIYLSQIQYHQVDYDKALNAIDLVLDQIPEYSYALYFKGTNKSLLVGIILYKQDKLQESLTIFQQLEQLEPYNLNVKNNIGIIINTVAQICLRLNDSQKAILLAKEILLQNPEFVYAKIFLGIEQNTKDKSKVNP